MRFPTEPSLGILRIARFRCVRVPPGVYGSNSCSAELLVWWDLTERIRQHRCVANAAAYYLNGPYLLRALVDSNVDITPNAALGAIMLARVPLASALSYDAAFMWRPVRHTAVFETALTPHETTDLRPSRGLHRILLPVETSKRTLARKRQHTENAAIFECALLKA